MCTRPVSFFCQSLKLPKCSRKIFLQSKTCTAMQSWSHYFLQVQTHIAGPEIQGCICEDCQRALHVKNMREMRDYQSEPWGSQNLHLQCLRPESHTRFSCGTQRFTTKHSLRRRGIVLKNAGSLDPVIRWYGRVL